MPLERLVPGQWMHLSKELRDHLAAEFKVLQSKATEIRDQEILSDGRDYNDLAVITKELMCAYVGSEETFARAWELTVAKAYYELHPPIGTIQPPQPPIDNDHVALGAEKFLDDVLEKDVSESKHGKNTKAK